MHYEYHGKILKHCKTGKNSLQKEVFPGTNRNWKHPKFDLEDDSKIYIYRYFTAYNQTQKGIKNPPSSGYKILENVHGESAKQVLKYQKCFKQKCKKIKMRSKCYEETGFLQQSSFIQTRSFNARWGVQIQVN